MTLLVTVALLALDDLVAQLNAVDADIHAGTGNQVLDLRRLLFVTEGTAGTASLPTRVVRHRRGTPFQLATSCCRPHNCLEGH